MKKPNPPPSKPSASAKPAAGMAPRKSRWGPPPAGAAGDKAASTSRRTPTPTRSSNARRHPAPTAPAPQARNPASPAAATRPPPHQQPRPDYPFEPAPLPQLPHFQRAGPEAWPPHQPPPQQQFPPHDKRRHPADPDEGFSRHPKQSRFEPPPHQPSQMQQPPVDRQALRKAFLKYSKMLNENSAQKRIYLEGGRVQCLPCGRSSKDFADVHGLVMHAYNPPNADSFVDHLGLHKALCVLKGWDYTKVPDNSKAYQSLPPDLVRANREDLIIWPPTVIIRNTTTGRKKDGRSEGLGNKEMDKKIAELGFAGGKSKSLYGKEGHLGLTLVKFANNPSGLKEAERLAEFFERQDHGRVGWSRAQATHNLDPDTNPMLVETDSRGEKKRILYGCLAISSDLDELDSDSRKRATVKSIKEFDPSD
ncbi:early nodulin-75-like [Triticum dicoccoides]|uniref:early nodulin-75-like n=1 Tax=Triticum dicoccoides TaxID=85692 RepID=UPI00188E6DEF|nr:early nodulin-75-like [Triticum dicoccoides]